MQKGGGLQFRNHVPLINAPDPRRFDLRASLRDPFEQIQFRVHQQTASIPVWVVADLSASMRFQGAQSKMQTLAALVSALSYSAYKIGDRFGFFGCSDDAAEGLLLPATVNRAAGMSFAESLARYEPRGHSCAGLVQAMERVGVRRSLVFVVSDFHFSAAVLEDVLANLAMHDVVPVVLWDEREYQRLPRFGLARVYDRESGRNRLLLMRQSLRQKFAANFAAREQALGEICRKHGCAPLFLRDGFNADEVTRYFYN